MLEDIENHFNEIKCYDSAIRLYFSTIETLEHAHAELNRLDRFVLITSHDGCNKDGERDTHMLACEIANSPVDSLLNLPGSPRLTSM